MQIYTNGIFKSLFNEYSLKIGDIGATLFSSEVINLLAGIPIRENGYIRVGHIQFYEEMNNLALSFDEDDSNHFHIDWLSNDEYKLSFLLGVQITYLLAQKFESIGMTDVRLWFSFETPEMGKEFAIINNFHELGDVYFASDRFSCFKKRGNENHIISLNEIQSSNISIMVIDI